MNQENVAQVPRLTFTSVRLIVVWRASNVTAPVGHAQHHSVSQAEFSLQAALESSGTSHPVVWFEAHNEPNHI
jgi:hypothetical protein